jgi:iron(III) transport system substrate-binding protein
MRKLRNLGLVSALLLTLVTACSSSDTKVSELTIYSGRAEEFIAPFFEIWQQQSGIKLNVRYGDSAELAAQILEEGKNSPADIFLSFTPIPTGVAELIPDRYSQANRDWIGVTARVRVFAYAPDRISLAPKTITDLTKPIYKNQLAIAPTNASFQAFLTAVIENKGRSFAKQWLLDLKKNGVKTYAKNSAIVEAIDKGKVSIGLVNHYYVWEVTESLGRQINAVNGYFEANDLGNLINVSGVGILASSNKRQAAIDLINFLTSESIQNKFVSDTHEYSLIQSINPPQDLPSLAQVGALSIDLEVLKNIKNTQDLLIEVGLL